MSAFGRLKRAVRDAIGANGKIEGAQMTTGKGSIVGDWNNRNHRALPTLADAHALDDLALIEAGRAPILEALAAELGFVAIRLPEVNSGGDAIAIEFARCAGEFGDVATALTEALSDGAIAGPEPERIVREIDEAQTHLARLRAMVLIQNERGGGDD